MDDAWFAAATRGSETGGLARAVDWAATPLGDPSGWPAGLRSAVELCFATRFPVMLVWGPELTMVYNDGYREMLGTHKRDLAMGVPVAEVWAEIWDGIGPLFDQVLTTGEPVWCVDEPLVMQRSGYVEDTWFTFGYSALRDADGTVRGAIDIATETTQQVVERRRMRTLGELSARLQALPDDVGRLTRTVTEVLDASDDVAHTDLYVTTGPIPTLVASTHPTDLVDDVMVAEIVATGISAVVDGTFVAPLLAAHPSRRVGAVVLAPSPRRPFDERYEEFLQLVATTVGTALSATLGHLREVGELRDRSDALQASLFPALELGPGWHTLYRPADGRLLVGGDWYDVVDLGQGRTGVVVGDCVGHGLGAAAVMGQLRSAARALMLAGARPGAVLEGLDRVARTVPGAAFATVLCGVVDAATGELVYSSAGHLPAVVSGTGGARLLDGGRGTPLTVDLGARPDARTMLAQGDTLVLYTDGLVERREETLDAGLGRLVATVPRLLARHGPAGLAGALVDALLPAGARDDVALVVHEHGRLSR
ncbi:SpoIIE family protein phosphatase [Cellulomonas sp. PhB143]|uniref:SpoIIE family protein phosphatase n=1 Tax=Cellulomonas sp. PhB143 TaxID=2485186 RepID=UPI000F48E67D|nr:SpoIIE family protein phosphatase [Cellulomonas sp. PhB143]ROS75306.1 serine phosphatase RsbU (regulator of sigma subunit) [Cellulomonas sp. PhB143]